MCARFQGEAGDNSDRVNAQVVSAQEPPHPRARSHTRHQKSIGRPVKEAAE